MSKEAKKTNATKLRQNKRMRRRWITFIRMCRYGVNNFSRNAWLTVAATAVMTITLLVIFSTLVARFILQDTVDNLRKKVDFSVYLRDDVKQNTVDSLKAKLEANPQVNRVTYISTDDARKAYIAQNRPSEEQLQTLAELKGNVFPAVLRINPKDLKQKDSIERLVATDREFKNNIDSAYPPTFKGSNSRAITTVGVWIDTAQKIGLVAAIVFISISILIIFNTIRMAIFNRREEIEMMKLIGAEKSFIQGPFVVEAMMYGFFAAIAAFLIGIGGFMTISPKLTQWGIPTENTTTMLLIGSPFIIIILILIGAFIGVISSFFAVRKHLKI
jgi:cell division transport system permease protein